jgi:hypothetical protein
MEFSRSLFVSTVPNAVNTGKKEEGEKTDIHVQAAFCLIPGLPLSCILKD